MIMSVDGAVSARSPSLGIRGGSQDRSFPVSGFVGPDRDMAEIGRLLLSTRLLTLTGAGGCGKTWLALQIATGMSGACPDGVWLIDLAAVTCPAKIPQVMISILGAFERSGCSFVEDLIDYLRPRALLLILDNCEHLAPACAGLAQTLLHAAPNLQILTTSRTALGVQGEIAWQAPALAVPRFPGAPRHAPAGHFAAEAVTAPLLDHPVSVIPLPAGLSVREAEVLQLVAQGMTNAQVAAALVISPHTAHAHLASIYGKLGVNSRGAAIRFAVENRLV